MLEYFAMFEQLSIEAARYWDLLINYYQVNPFIFIAMYSIKSVIFWWTVILIVKRAIQRKWDSLPPLVLLNVSTNVSPWVYVWICGRNQPFWYPYMVYFVGGWGLCYLTWEVRRRYLEHVSPSAKEGSEGNSDLLTASAENADKTDLSLPTLEEISSVAADKVNVSPTK